MSKQRREEVGDESCSIFVSTGWWLACGSMSANRADMHRWPGKKPIVVLISLSGAGEEGRKTLRQIDCRYLQNELALDSAPRPGASLRVSV